MNEAQALTLEAGKYYRTRGGKKVFIVGVNPFDKEDDDIEFPFGGFVQGLKGDVLEWFRDDGRYGVQDGANDLVAEWVEPKRIKGRMFIGNNGVVFFGGSIGEEPAVPYGVTALACIEIDVLEGHGLKGEAA